MPLPPSRSEGAYRIAVVCLGNICRSPIAEVVLRERLIEAGLADQVELSSAGTGSWHVGNPMDPRAAAVLRQEGYDPSLHRARQFDADGFGGYDLVLAMDGNNQADLVILSEEVDDRERVRLFREFDPEAGGDLDVPDPYYGGDEGFRDVLAMVERTAEAIVKELAALR